MVLTNLCCYIVLKIVFLFTIMDPFESIQIKLHQFTRKYYTSELIKGVILFFSFGFLYLFFILFLEHSLWFKPTSRTFLFYFFLGVEFFLLIRFIAFPFLKMANSSCLCAMPKLSIDNVPVWPCIWLSLISFSSFNL